MTGLLTEDIPEDAFLDGEVLNEPKWFTRVFSKFNKMRETLDPFQLVWVGVRGSATLQSLPANAWQAITLDTMIIDTLSIGLDTGGFRVPVGGVYECTAYATFLANTTSLRRIVEVLVNGLDSEAGKRNISSQSTIGPPAGTIVVPGSTVLLNLVAGDLIQCGEWHDATSTLTVGANSVSARPALSIRRYA